MIVLYSMTTLHNQSGFWCPTTLDWKSNQVRPKYSTYDQELRPWMLVLSFQSRVLGTNPVLWLCNQEAAKTVPKGAPPEKAQLR